MQLKYFQQGAEKDSNKVNNRENGLRLKNEKIMKEKDLVFLPTRRKEKRKVDQHCTFANRSSSFTNRILQKSAIFATHKDIFSIFEF